MNIFLNLFLFAGFYTRVAYCEMPLSQCEATNESAVKFAVTSHRNTSGHWQYKLTVEHKKAASYRPWFLHVDENTVSCDGVEYTRTTTTITAPAPKAGPGYEYYPGVGYYKLHVDKMAWQEARVKCENEGAHLAILNSEAESVLLKNMFARYSNESVWIFLGFHDLYREGQFVTIFDEPLETTGFTRWLSGQPDNAGNGEHCGSLHSTLGTINDLDCSVKTYFVCEQEIP